MILLSACLAGLPCRYDGASKPVPELMALALRGEALLVCPEVLGGLPTPRLPSERQPDGRVRNQAGEDVTAQYTLGAERALEICRAHGCSLAVLKARSPSCGKGVIYDGSFTHSPTSGDGVCAALLQAHGIEVLTEEEYLLTPHRPVTRARTVGGGALDAPPFRACPQETDLPSRRTPQRRTACAKNQQRSNHDGKKRTNRTHPTLRGPAGPGGPGQRRPGPGPGGL